MKKIIFLTILFFLPVLCLADTTSVPVTTGDTDMHSVGANWVQTRDVAVCDAVYQDIITIRSGAWGKTDGSYYDRRAFLCFPTLNYLSVAHVVVWCSLFIYIDAGDWINSDNQVSIHHIVEAVFATSPATVNDFEIGVDIGTTSGGSRDFAGLSLGNWYGIEMNSTGLSWIAKDDSTYLVLISKPTLDDNAPADDSAQAIRFRTFEDGHKPYLRIGFNSYAPSNLHTDDHISYKWSGGNYAVLKAMCNDSRAYCDEVWWQIGTSPNDSDKYNSGWLDLTTDVDSAVMMETKSWSKLTNIAQWYYIRCKTKNTAEGVSDWSAPDSFRNVLGCTLNVGFRVDSESGDQNMDDCNQSHPTIYFDTWHKVDSDEGGAWKVLQKSYRDDYLDDLDSLPRFNWNFIIGEAVCSASGTWEDEWEACRSVADTGFNLIYQCMVDDSGYQDEVGFHYTHWDLAAAPCGSGWGWGGHDDYDTTQARRLVEELIWHWRYPFILANNAGWNKGNDRMNILNENFSMFDYSCVNLTQGHADWLTAPKHWFTYNPDTTGIDVEGDMIHYIGQAGWWGDFGGVDEPPFESVFDSAGENTGEGWANLIIYAHTFTEVTKKLWNVLDLVYDSLSVNSDSCNIPFRWVNFTEAERFTKKWTDVTPPNLIISLQGSDSIQVLSNEVIEQETPIGLTIDADTLARIDFAEATSQSWRYSRTKFPGKAIFVVTDTCNNARVDSFSGEHGIKEIYINSAVQKILDGGDIFEIIGIK